MLSTSSGIAISAALIFAGGGYALYPKPDINHPITTQSIESIDSLTSDQKLAFVALAAIDTVAWAEIGPNWNDSQAFRTMFGGAKFDSFADHPRDIQAPAGTHLRSDAAGKFQFMSPTWDEIYNRYDYWPTGENGEKFVPEAQTLAFLRLFAETSAFYELERGMVVLHGEVSVKPEAVAKAMNAAADTWCALPGDDRKECAGQPQKKEADTVAFFNESLLRHQKVSLQATQKLSSILNISKDFIGKDFKKGSPEQCAFFVRHVFKRAGVDLPNSQDRVSSGDPEAGLFGEGAAASLIGGDVGRVFRVDDFNQIPEGAIVAFTNTYGAYPLDAITHVGISIGNGMMVDRPTSAKPVQHRKINKFPSDSQGKYTYVMPSSLVVPVLPN